MRAFLIVLMVVPCLLLAALGVIGYKLLHAFPVQRGVETPVTTPPEPSPYELAVSSAAEGGWTLLTSWRLQDEGGPATCGEAHRRYAYPTTFDAGRSAMTLKATPQSGQKLVLTAVRVRFVSAEPLPPTPHHLAHCAGDHQPPVVRAEGRAGEVVDVGVAPREVGPDGFRQDFAVEVTGTRTATWQVEVDLTIDGLAVTKVLPKASSGHLLVTAPVPADVTGHAVWCDRAFRVGESC
ncbi:hypothetical protein PV646_03130 [Streptomyces sp. ID05-26A]|nr:hypothetical protein [Streptomyces sp. ID05-26A]